MKKGYHLPKAYKMKVLLKQTVGIDVAQNELVVSLGRMDEHTCIEIYAYEVFPNSKKGFSKPCILGEKKNIQHYRCAVRNGSNGSLS